MAVKDDHLARKERSLELLLTEGKGYLVVMDEIRNYSTMSSSEHWGVLAILNGYSRYKTELSEDIAELRETYGYDGFNCEDYETEEEIDDMMGYMDVEIEGRNNDDDLFVQEESRHFNDVVRRKNILANIEILVRQMLEVDAVLFSSVRSIRTELSDPLRSYCHRAGAFLKRNASFADPRRDLGKKRSIKNIRIKYVQLRQLLDKLTELW